MFNLLLDAAANTSGGGLLGGFGIWGTVAYIAIFGVFIYFVILIPQKKEQKKIQTMLSNMEVGDAVVTTSGFYGVLIDITDEDVIVEFGNNKNCRIPMKKSAIAQIEKAE
ncbi:MAG: preprotein translocase subunit YajC [Lachnospiraceae bacterium]|nr:preprotein translocase subunit YajC [Lachnospiraceae bacterium]